jgi:hypothetical protein
MVEDSVDVFVRNNMQVSPYKMSLDKNASKNGKPETAAQAGQQAGNMVDDPFDYPVNMDMFDRPFCIKSIGLPY